MLAAVSEVVDILMSYRNEQDFEHMLNDCTNIIKELDLDEIVIPRQRKAPKRYAEAGETFQPQKPSDYFRPLYFKMIDTATQHLKDRFEKSEGLAQYMAIEEVLLNSSLLSEKENLL
jgi:hypothetical protein